MVIIKKNNSRPSHSGAGNHIFKTKNMSYYSSSLSENLTSKNYRIFAYASRGGPRQRMSTSRCEDADDHLIIENMTIVNHLKKLVKQGGDQKKKRKTNINEKQKGEFEGLYVIDENFKKIDLNFIASTGDDVFESVLKKMTNGMVREDQLLGVLNSLDGTWGSHRKRRKYVDAVVFAKLLPVNWKILLSLRPRVSQPSLYCRRFVSPSGVHLNSCKDVAFYLKSQLLTTDTSPPEELAIMQVDNDCQVDVESELDHLEDTAMNHGELIGFPLNGEGSSSFPKTLNDPKKRSEEGKLKRRCMWCLVAFFCEHVDAETLMSSSGFICPKCQEDAAWRFKNALSELIQDVGK